MDAEARAVGRFRREAAGSTRNHPSRLARGVTIRACARPVDGIGRVRPGTQSSIPMFGTAHLHMARTLLREEL